VVTEAGRHGGHGNYVELDHVGPYGTSYSHLSAILVRRGQKVKQGDLIGRVGSTGLSTGPHLHYQMTVNGSFVDPTTVALPMTGGLSAPDLTAFRRVRDEIMGQLSGE
jgi:murein DD-endopeptidase MepM/ murein hydrolase activator NlpD